MTFRKHIRKAVPSDAGAIKRIETECGLSPWKFEDYVAETLREDTVFLVSTKEGELAGFLVARLIMNQNTDHHQNKDLRNTMSKRETFSNSAEFENEAEIHNIGVGKKYRRNRIGTDLLENLTAIAEKKNVPSIWLDVRASNQSAIRFYESHGFRIIQKRKDFYRDPVEDAYLMNLRLSDTI